MRIRIYCPSRPKEPYRAVIDELLKRAGVELISSGKIPKSSFRVLLDPGGEQLSISKLGKILEGKKDVLFIVGGPDGIEVNSDLKLSLGKFVVNHQIALIVLLDILFRLRFPHHPYNKH